MLEKVKKTYRNSFDFDYTPEAITKFSRYVYDNRDKLVSRGAFAVRLDIHQFVELIKRCSASQIYDLREIFHTIYSFSNIDDFFMGDRESLVELRDKISELQNEGLEFDKIQNLQLNYLKENLDKFIDRLNKQ